MTEDKTKIVRPITMIVTADDGGTGKTTFATQIVAFARLNNVEIKLFQLDSKEKLAAKTGQTVTSLNLQTSGRGGDELVPSDIISPWYAAATSDVRTSTLLEVGGANAGLFHSGIADFDLDEDIQELDLDVRTFVICKAGEDSARQTIREIARLETNIPSGKVIIVRNEMNGCPRLAAQYLDSRLRKEFLSLLEKYDDISMPRVHPRSMTLYERLHVSPDVIIDWRLDGYREAMARTSSKRPEAKLFVKDIAEWTGLVFDQLVGVFPEWVNDNE